MKKLINNIISFLVFLVGKARQNYLLSNSETISTNDFVNGDNEFKCDILQEAGCKKQSTLQLICALIINGRNNWRRTAQGFLSRFFRLGIFAK